MAHQPTREEIAKDSGKHSNVSRATFGEDEDKLADIEDNDTRFL